MTAQGYQTESVNKALFSKLFHNSISMLAMVQEMATVEGWESLDECHAKKPDTLSRYCALAEAAQRGLSKQEKQNPQTQQTTGTAAFVIAYMAATFSGGIVGVL